MRRLAGGGALGVVAVGSVVGGTGVASAEQTVGSHGITVTVPDSCDIYLRSGLAESFPDSGHARRCLAEKSLSTPAATDVSTVSQAPTPDGTSSTTSSSDGSSSSTTTTTTTTPAPDAPSSTAGSTPTTTPAPTDTSSTTTPSTAPTPVKTESGANSDDPDDQPAAPGETKSVPIG